MRSKRISEVERLLQRASEGLSQRGLDPLEEGLPQRLQRGLEARGIEADLRERLFDQLSQQAVGMSTSQFEALLDGAALACGAQHGSEEEFVDNPEQVREIERMMQAFAGELSKLDESLEVLAAYVRRMRTPVRAPRSSTDLLH